MVAVPQKAIGDLAVPTHDPIRMEGVAAWGLGGNGIAVGGQPPTPGSGRSHIPHDVEGNVGEHDGMGTRATPLVSITNMTGMVGGGQITTVPTGREANFQGHGGTWGTVGGDMECTGAVGTTTTTPKEAIAILRSIGGGAGISGDNLEALGRDNGILGILDLIPGFVVDQTHGPGVKDFALGIQQRGYPIGATVGDAAGGGTATSTANIVFGGKGIHTGIA